MNRPVRTALPLLAALLAAAALAQGANTKSLGTGKGGRLLTMEELRACMAQQQDLALRKPGLESERAALERERGRIDQTEAALKDDDAKIRKLAQTADDIGRRTRELQQRIAAYNDNAARFQSANASGPTADRQRRALDNEKAAIDRDTAQLESDRAAPGPGAEQMAKDFNARVEARNRAVDDWNARNQALAKKTQAYETDRQNWQIDCQGKSYREDDEKAIQKGR